ncbi:MAG: transglutaminase domain-containing protein [Myxococcota bacterium]
MTARILTFLLKTAVALVALSIPLVGAWLGSSLAAMLDGPKWVAPVVALLGFPVLPFLWEGWARARRKDEAKKAILTTWDRVILRTLVLNFAFVSAFVAFDSNRMFTALSTRGDWMLDDAEGPRVEQVRSGLFATVEGLEWLLIGAEADNLYRDLVDDDAPPPDLGDSARPSDPVPAPNDSAHSSPTSRDQRPSSDSPLPAVAPERSDSSNDAPERDSPSPAVAPERNDSLNAPDRNGPAPTAEARWPFSQTPSAAANRVPPGAEDSVRSLGQHFRAIADPLERTRAIHDWIAVHISYDVALLRRLEGGERVSATTQDAATVLRARRGVCAGYSNLMKALGDEAGIDVRVITGHTKDSAALGGVGHAWNAVKIGERWHLIDATWNAGYVNGDTFTRRYTSDYFLTPPAVFGTNHFPDQAEWQLLETPLTRAEFLRLLNMRPAFFRQGLTLEAPTRSQSSTSGSAQIRLKNPERQFVMVNFGAKGAQPSTQCGNVSNGTQLTFNCELPRAGIYEVHVFTNPARAGSVVGGGAVEVVRQ